MNCQSCRFASHDQGCLTHQCRRRAPVAEKVESWIDGRQWVPRFPIVRADDWCGEFDPKPESEALREPFNQRLPLVMAILLGAALILMAFWLLAIAP